MEDREDHIQRLQAQQQELHDEVSRREKAIHKLEVELLTAQEEQRQASDDVSIT